MEMTSSMKKNPIRFKININFKNGRGVFEKSCPQKCLRIKRKKETEN